MASLGTFDTRPFRRLSRSFVDMEQQFPGLLQECVREVAIQLFAKIVRRTPVDTGMLRRNWRMSRVQPVAGGYEITISNPTEYAPYVEFGHRVRTMTGYGWVEGRFMMTISESQMQRDLPAVIERKLTEYVESHWSV